MKELVTAFAACAIAGAVMAADSNIVGYTSKGILANQKIISGAQFVECTSNVLDIASIKLEGVDMDASATIQWWNGTGYGTAWWVEKDWDSGTPWWGEEEDWEVGIPKTFNPSEGFWVSVRGATTPPQVKIVNQVL